MDGLKISELQDTDSYKYLGADEDVAYRGTLNKDRVVKEYIKRDSENLEIGTVSSK